MVIVSAFYARHVSVHIFRNKNTEAFPDVEKYSPVAQICLIKIDFFFI